MAKTFHDIPARSGRYLASSSVVWSRNTSEKKVIKHRRSRWLRFLLVLGYVLMIVLGIWIIWLQAVVPAATNLNDQWHYGDARITQLDANVGHGGTSHFLAEYYQGRIVVIELSLSNPNEYHTYTLGGMMGTQGIPRILLTLADLNHDRKPDLLIQVDGTEFTVTLYNTGTAFTQNGR